MGGISSQKGERGSKISLIFYLRCILIKSVIYRFKALTNCLKSDILINKENQQYDGNKEAVMKAVIYARYSCDNQREESIEGQLRECKAFAERKGFKMVGTYIDRAMSAKTDNRPQFQKMIKDS